MKSTRHTPNNCRNLATNIFGLFRVNFLSSNLAKPNLLKSALLKPGLLKSGLVTLGISLALGGCGGGSGAGSNVTLTTDNQGEDPVVVEIPIAYIRRPLPEEPTDLRNPLTFNPGAELYVRDRSATSAADIDVTAKILEIVSAQEDVEPEDIALDIKDIESSFDGKTLIFTARAVVEPVADNIDQTTWNLWTYDIETQIAQYVIASRIKRNEGVETGGGHDIAPYFLPDDRIVFSSTRQVTSQGRQLNEGRAQLFAALDENLDDPAAVLHIYDPQMRDDEFRQISFNLSHDLDPVVLGSGEIIFSRWNNTATNHVSLFRINPNGLALSPLYGFHSRDAGTEGASVAFTQAREMDDGRLLSLMKPFASESFGGEIVIIDAQNYSEPDQAIWGVSGVEGAAQESLTTTEIRTDGALSRGGQYGAVYPLRDGTNRLLVTWSQCRIFDEESDSQNTDAPRILPCTLQPDNTDLAPALFGAWIYNPIADTQRPIVLAEEGFIITEIIAAEPKDFAALVTLPADFDNDLALQNKGLLRIHSVYDLDGQDNSALGISNHAQPGTAAHDNRSARFLRILQPVPIPDRDVFEIPGYASGVAGGLRFREILGYVPIEPDGSVTVTVPAQRPFSFSVLDGSGRRIGSAHNYWLQLAAGEVVQCTGCHDAQSNLPHGRLDSQPASSNPGARALGNGTLGFPGTRSTELFATESGESMAQVWDFHRPLGNTIAAQRELLLEPSYTPQWYDLALTPDASITELGYSEEWTDIPSNRPLIVSNLDPGQPSRIVINYVDHIQPIWERTREGVLNSEEVIVDTCTGCHSSQEASLVSAGQLDLTAVASDIDPDHYRSYRELLSTDQEEWLNNNDALEDRMRICTALDEDGNEVITTQTVSLPSPMRGGSANASVRFFNCFEGGRCGSIEAPPLPANCTEDGGTPIPATVNTIDHRGMLSAPELRLISEWLDIGAQYYNNPFDARLTD